MSAPNLVLCTCDQLSAFEVGCYGNPTVRTPNIDRQAASGYLGKDLSTIALFGFTGHAFLLNIHAELCPSGPYVWKKGRFWARLSGLGLEAVGHYSVSQIAGP